MKHPARIKPPHFSDSHPATIYELNLPLRLDIAKAPFPREDLREPEGALQIPPLRCAPVGMTRGERLRFGRLATWMERLTNLYFATTADPSTRCASVGMTRGQVWLWLELQSE